MVRGPILNSVHRENPDRNTGKRLGTGVHERDGRTLEEKNYFNTKKRW